MKSFWSSLSVRLLVASFIWTLGLLYVTHITSVYIIVGPGAFIRLDRIALMSLLALAFMVCGALVFRRTIRSFLTLRRRLMDVQEGRERRVTGDYVSEVQPIVSALNSLLDHQEGRVRQAVAKAGDLAHGLKTPLAVLSQEANRARAGGHEDIATTLEEQVVRMQRHLDYHLAHARAAASGATPGTHCSVAASAEGIRRTLERLHAQRNLTISISVPEGHVVRGQREDVDEMLGNLLDNACKWARSRVALTSTNGRGRIVITVDDDGPGIPVELRGAVLQRGVRADQAAPGSGFGLAIVRDLAEVYGGSIALDSSPDGGLRARLDLPQAIGDHSGTVQVH
jgi:signal transduction histidine kinase